MDNVAANNSYLVVVPLYNEELNVDAFFQHLAKAAESGGLSGVVVVDDGSTDQTVSRLETYLRDYLVSIRLVRLSRNFGHQSAVLAGCEVACSWAEEDQIPWIGVIDGDLQDRPEDFPTLLDQGQDQDVVYAVRAQRHDGLLMKVLAPVFYKLLSVTSTFPIPQNAGTFSIIRTPICKLIVESADAEPYFPGLRAWTGFRQKGVLLDRQARQEGESKVALFGLIRLSLRAVVLHSDLPLRLLVSFTLLLFGGLSCLAVAVIALRLAQVILPTGVTTIILLQIFSLGLCAACFTIVAFMVNRVKSNTTRQRSWVVMEVIQSPPARHGKAS